MRKYILFGLSIILSCPVLAKTPPLSAEQTVRQIYQDYEQNDTSIYFGDIRSPASSRIKNELALNDLLMPPGEIGWLNFDPICNCQDYDNFTLENITTSQHDADRASVTVRFRLFGQEPESTTQTLKLVTENGRWQIDDIVSQDGSLWQMLHNENQRILASLTSLQREQPQDFVGELFRHSTNSYWPWTGIFSPEYRQAVDEYYRSTIKGHSMPERVPEFFGRLSHDAWPWPWTGSWQFYEALHDYRQDHLMKRDDSQADMKEESQYLYDNPVCGCAGMQFASLGEIRLVERTADRAQVHIRFTLTDTTRHERDVMLQRAAGRWEISDIIRPVHGSLLKQMQEATRKNLQ
ncbi:hypothetical protein CHU32_14470 [Superficieibacter electus]|uniref:DUF3828 domain-containing protein n=1 Tax=Superficieibacter electus TaxID=2022662 RepID=A0A2P5GNE5_9ENTR|nr:DUF3828 domain-containing protein [Superficieibacter electus]POP43576.1 hypothetical protein CHU33_15180 [Superficieibacter electus]POP48044.1 hypothetical protein CHU32_14470 [Superficieibacter electus]